MATTKLMTADDLWLLEPEPGFRYELIEGVLHKMPAGGARHGKIGFDAGRRLGNFVAEHDLGWCFTSETGFVLFHDPDEVVMPDVAFVRTDRLPPADHEGYLQVPPDLVIEVVSPSDRPAEVRQKAARYLEAGVSLLWLVEPKHRGVTVFRPGRPAVFRNEAEMLDGEDVVPGFRLPIVELFR
jgi:Uma2 family endonuclease